MRVLIVGAGIAGPTLAYWLLRAGHESPWSSGLRICAGAAISSTSGAPASTWPSGWASSPSCGGVAMCSTEARAVDRDGHRVASVEAVRDHGVDRAVRQHCPLRPGGGDLRRARTVRSS